MPYRPPVKPCRISFVCTPEMAAVIDMLAAKDNTTTSDICRQLITDGLRVTLLNAVTEDGQPIPDSWKIP